MAHALLSWEAVLGYAVAGAVLAKSMPIPSRSDVRQTFRAALDAHIENLIALADRLDGDPDLEDGADAEPEEADDDRDSGIADWDALSLERREHSGGSFGLESSITAEQRGVIRDIGRRAIRMRLPSSGIVVTIRPTATGGQLIGRSLAGDAA